MYLPYLVSRYQYPDDHSINHIFFREIISVHNVSEHIPILQCQVLLPSVRKQKEKEIYVKNLGLKDSDVGVWHSELLRFWTLSIVRNLKN
jgi:hypothetical protein